VHTLHHYDAIGLLQPSGTRVGRRTQPGYRRWRATGSTCSAHSQATIRLPSRRCGRRWSTSQGWPTTVSSRRRCASSCVRRWWLRLPLGVV